MDNLGKAYGQHPASSGPFRLQHIGSWCPGWLSLPEREKVNLLVPFYRNHSEDTPAKTYRGAYIINKVFLGILLDISSGRCYHYSMEVMDMSRIEGPKCRYGGCCLLLIVARACVSPLPSLCRQP